MFLIWLGLLWALINLLARRFPLRSAKTSLSLTSPLSVHISTARFNALPTQLLDLLAKREAYWRDQGRRWSTSWDVGALIGVVGVVVSQGVLLWAAARAVRVAWEVWTAGGDVGQAGVGLVKRGLAQTVTGGGNAGASNRLVLQAVIPGLTTPLSTLPPLLLALLLSQFFHELGHALAAASESIPLLATGLHVHLLLPSAYVALPSTIGSSHGPMTELRVATAGIVHNVVLCAVVGAAWQAGVAGWGKWTWGREVEGGLVVVGVDQGSALASHLPIGTLLTSLDDLELDSSPSPLNLWHTHLSSPSPTSAYSSLGWCLPADNFSLHPTDCCAPISASTSTPSPAASAEHKLCFARTEDHSTACLPALPLFPPSREIPSRCLTDTSCQRGSICARIRQGEKVLRIGVKVGEGGEGGERTVIWQGERRAVPGQVAVTDTVPRLGLVPIWLPHALATFASHIFSLSLTLAFLNSLPLPRLDGSAIVSALRRSLAVAASGARSLDGLEAAIDTDEGPLSPALIEVRGWRVVQAWVRAGEGADRALKRWTMGVGGALVLATVAVGLAGRG